ncbi:lipase (class 3) [Paraburkholderia sp. BL6669N2]|uniref:lipase family protein n=1 Tax=Paraburkholderia sp. BL6669N2 TaxID=1938807 RepID=UPI000E272B0E|nr:lipase family protein [Paraburkholderia sp. BL6669N2]REG48566.1 lipase (class 3) [Paraburkholderia sp. BL6669N2]
MLTIAYDPGRPALYLPERREALFSRGENYSVLQLASEMSRLAYLRFETSKTEYARLRLALNQIDFSHLTIFTDTSTGTEAYGAYRTFDKLAIVAFRGTQPDKIKDLLTNLRSTFVRWPVGSAKVHRGFATAALRLIKSIENWLSKLGGSASKVLLVGHSLGGALATLISTLITGAHLVTIGAPRVGDSDFVNCLNPDAAVRLVNCCDLVPGLPFKSLGFRHGIGVTYLSSNAKIWRNPGRTLIKADRVTARREYLRCFSPKRNNVLLRDFADHAPINYIRVLFQKSAD